jgi:hypothetical protein
MKKPEMTGADPVSTDTSGAAAKAFPGDTTAHTSMSRVAIEVTNRRYQNDIFWAPPKGLRYGLLVGALPIQQPTLYPDEGATYFVSQFKLPKGSSLTLRGEYGHLRYFSFTVANQLGNGQLGNGDSIRDNEIEPDSGSFNPFLPSSNRNVTPRNYTVHIVQGAPPKDRAPNTVYTNSNSESAPIHLSIRAYIPDVGFDGTGNVELDHKTATVPYGLPEVTLNLPGGRELKGKAMAKALQVSRENEATGFSRGEWLELVKDSRDSVNAPAVPTVEFQRFWDASYSINGLFVPDPAERVRLFPPNNNGGFANNPDTIYEAAVFSLNFGQVVVVKAKMPTHQTTRHGQETWKSGTNLRYFSVSASGAPPSGVGWTSLFDEEIPVDKDGNFTLVMSWAEDRPKNATKKCGVAWIDFGGGEGHYVGARNWVNFLYFRYQNMNRDWPQSPANIPIPTTENPIPQDAKVMQEFYPRAIYMSKADFEALGPQVVSSGS